MLVTLHLRSCLGLRTWTNNRSICNTCPLRIWNSVSASVIKYAPGSLIKVLRIQERSAPWPDLLAVHPEGDGDPRPLQVLPAPGSCDKASCSFLPLEQIATGRVLPFNETICSPKLPPGGNGGAGSRKAKDTEYKLHSEEEAASLGHQLHCPLPLSFYSVLFLFSMIPFVQEEYAAYGMS